MLATIELGAQAALWAKENAKPILAGTTILFAGLWSRSCIQSNGLALELEACRNKPPTIQEVKVLVKQKCAGNLDLKYPQGSPCPDIKASFDAGNDFALGVTQTAGASVGEKVPPLGPWTLALGASHYADLWHPSAGVGYSLPRLGGYEFGVMVDASALAFSGEPGLYPAYGAKLTVRR